MSTDLFGVRVLDLNPVEKKITFRIFVVYYDIGEGDDPSHFPLPTDATFFFRILRESADNHGEPPHWPLAGEVSMDEWMNEGFVNINAMRFVERNEIIERRNDPVADYSKLVDFYYERDGCWDQEEDLVQADYHVWVTSEKWMEHLTVGQSWGTGAYEGGSKEQFTTRVETNGTATIEINRKSMTLEEFMASRNLAVGHGLNLENSAITALPEGLSVGGNLGMYNCSNITVLPEGLSVGGHLDLTDTGIAALPEGLCVGGDLNLDNTSVATLSEGLRVGGDLSLYGCANIAALPEGLRVGKRLDLEGSGIEALPEGLSVNGDLILTDTPIASLPEGLNVGGDLGLYGCVNITTLPKGLRVGGDLYLTGSGIAAVPEGVHVGGEVDPD